MLRDGGPLIVPASEVEAGQRIDYNIILPPKISLLPAQFAVLKREYRGRLDSGTPTEDDQDVLHASQLTEKQIGNLEMDITFLINNPSTPMANICSRLDNYRPGNDSQRAFLRKARNFLRNIDPARPRGIYAIGSTGVGKTHIAIGLAKEIMRTGDFHPFYVQSDDYRRLHDLEDRMDHHKLDPNTVLILDDINSPYGIPWGVTKQAALYAYNYGTVLFVTSNTPYEEMLRNGFAVDQEEKPRYLSRTEYLFDFVDVRGPDFRVTQHPVGRSSS